MPFYEYQCSACGHHHEELQKVTDRPMRKCPACGRTTLRRLVSAPVFRLKGSGWYETDFKAEKEGKRNLAGEREPAAEKSKEVETGAVAKDAGTETGTKAKPSPTDAKPKTAADRKKPAQGNTTRRRARK